MTRLKEAAHVTEEAFADAAKGQSENPATAPNGGKLTGPVRENPKNPTDPYQRLIKMKPGEITEPISYQGRYFILRRGEDVPKSFEDAKKELEVSLRNRRAYGVAAELAQKIADSLKQNKDVQKTRSTVCRAGKHGGRRHGPRNRLCKTGRQCPEHRYVAAV